MNCSSFHDTLHILLLYPEGEAADSCCTDQAGNGEEVTVPGIQAAGSARALPRQSRNVSVKIGVIRRMCPLLSIIEVIPVLAARTSGTRFSTARKTVMDRCWYGAEDLPNQASLVMLTRIRLPART